MLATVAAHRDEVFPPFFRPEAPPKRSSPSKRRGVEAILVSAAGLRRSSLPAGATGDFFAADETDGDTVRRRRRKKLNPSDAPAWGVVAAPRGVHVLDDPARWDDPRASLRAVANAGRVCVGRTRAMARGVALGARDAAASRSASWNRAARVTRGAQNIRRATAPNGACFFAIAPAARPSARCRFPTRRKRPARHARDPPVSPTRASDGPGRTISSSPRSRRPSSGTNATTHHRVFF